MPGRRSAGWIFGPPGQFWPPPEITDTQSPPIVAPPCWLMTGSPNAACLRHRRRGHSVGEIAAYAMAVSSPPTMRSALAVRSARDGQRPVPPATGMAAGARRRRTRSGPARAWAGPGQPQHTAGQIVAAGSVAALEAGRGPAGPGRLRQQPPPARFHPMALGSMDMPPQPRGLSADEHHIAVECRRPAGHLGSDAMDKLIAQMTLPVRWDLCTEDHTPTRHHGGVSFPRTLTRNRQTRTSGALRRRQNTRRSGRTGRPVGHPSGATRSSINHSRCRKGT